MQRVLPALVADAGRGGRFLLLEQLAGEVEVGLGGNKVEDCLGAGQEGE